MEEEKVEEDNVVWEIQKSAEIEEEEKDQETCGTERRVNPSQKEKEKLKLKKYMTR